MFRPSLRRLLLIVTLIALFTLLMPARAQQDDAFFALMDEAIAAYFEGDYDQAIRIINDALELNSRSGFAYDWRGWIRYIQQDFDAALRDLDRAVDLEPTDPIFYIDRGMIHAVLGNEEEALADYDSAIAINDDYGFSADREVEDISGAEFLIRNYSIALDANPNDYVALAFRAAQYANIGMFEEAITDYGRALELQPDFDAIQDDLADARDLLANPDGRTVYCYVPNFDVVERIELDTELVSQLDNITFAALRCVRVENTPATIQVEMTAASGDLEPSLALYDAALNALVLPEDLQRDTDTRTLEYTLSTPGDYLVLFAREGLENGTSAGRFTATITLTNGGDDEQLVRADVPPVLATMCANANVLDVNKCNAAGNR